MLANFPSNGENETLGGHRLITKVNALMFRSSLYSNSQIFRPKWRHSISSDLFSINIDSLNIREQQIFNNLFQESAKIFNEIFVCFSIALFFQGVHLNRSFLTWHNSPSDFPIFCLFFRSVVFADILSVFLRSHFYYSAYIHMKCFWQRFHSFSSQIVYVRRR